MSRFILPAGALLLCLLPAPSAQSVEVPFTGTLTLEIGTLPPVEIEGSGVATVNGRAPFVGPLNRLTIPAGAFATPVAAFATPVGAFATVVLENIANRTVEIRRGRSCTEDHPNVTCPGHGLAGFGGLSGTAFFDVVTTATGSVPLSPIGGGSIATGPGITLSGAGWTTGSVAVYNPLAGTTRVITGSRERKGNELTLVTPVQIFVDGVGAVPSFATLQIRLSRDPMAPPVSRRMMLVAVGAGAAGLLLMKLRRS